VPSGWAMKHLRHWVPIFGILALLALFLKLPETPNLFDVMGCKACSSADPFLPLIGASYFTALIAASLLFPSFPGRLVARGGLTWAVLLALTLSIIDLPGWCAVCLIGHACNISIWAIWVIVPPLRSQPRTSTLKERLCLMLFAPISVVAMFSSLNLTFMAYGLKSKRNVAISRLQPGDAVPGFSAQTVDGRLVTDDVSSTAGLIINFVSSGCPHCKEQLQVLNAVATELADSNIRFINISPMLSPGLIQGSVMEWVEDREGDLGRLFQVTGYPTAFVVGEDGRITQIIPGVPDQLKGYLLASLAKDVDL
jgi:thiol-disulfide isomerase/thioredoxin